MPPKTFMTPEQVAADLEENEKTVYNPTGYVKNTKEQFTTQAVGLQEEITESHGRIKNTLNCRCGWIAKSAHRLGKHIQKFNSNYRLKDAYYDPDKKGWFVFKSHPTMMHQVPVRVS